MLTSVLALLESLLERWAKSSLFWVVSKLRPFLKFTGRADLVAAVSLAGVRRSRPIIEVLGDADQELVVRACAAGRVSARNAAITLLAVTTGLRACDIIALRLADVDWRGATIGIIQRKTGNPLTLPLPALVMGKLAGYVLGERRATADEHVFVRSLAPHVRLADHASVHQVISATFAAAGVADAKAGTRFLRHSWRRGCCAQRCRCRRSRPFGHAAEDSTSVYMNADRERLLQCVLPVLPGHGDDARFASAFAADLEGYLAFKQNVGLRRSPVSVHAAVRRLVRRAQPDLFDQGTVEGWVEPSWKARAGTARGCLTSATFVHRPAMTTPACCRTGGKPRSIRRGLTC